MSILAIREILTSGSPHKAERQLAQIAHDQGDNTLALIVADLTPGEVASFLEEGDYTKPSEVVPHLTKEQFMGAVDRFGSKWGKLTKNDSREILLRLKEEVAEFILPSLLFREDHLFIKAMLDDTLGEDILVILPLYEVGYVEILRDFEAGMTQKGSWQELYAIIEEMDPKAFASLKGQVLALADKVVRDEDEDDEPKANSEGMKFLRGTLQQLSNRAAKHAGENVQADQVEEVFHGI
jgi:hypothetical protein